METQPYNFQKICINGSQHGWYVSKEGYEQIMRIIQDEMICRHCKEIFSNETNPNVAGNLCLRCFLQRNSGYKLTYIGNNKSYGYVEKYGESDKLYYIYISQEGWAYRSNPGPGTGEEPKKSDIETIKYWNFPLPTNIRQNGKSIPITSTDHSIHGDHRGNVVVVHCYESPKQIISAYFISSNVSGRVTQLNLRKRSHQELMKAAREKDRGYPYHGLAELLSQDESLWPEPEEKVQILL